MGRNQHLLWVPAPSPVFQALFQPPGCMPHLYTSGRRSTTAFTDRQSVDTMNSAAGYVCSSTEGCCRRSRQAAGARRSQMQEVRHAAAVFR
jgi:hypothetical protein